MGVLATDIFALEREVMMEASAVNHAACYKQRKVLWTVGAFIMNYAACYKQRKVLWTVGAFIMNHAACYKQT
jgi:hypothetical protein